MSSKSTLIFYVFFVIAMILEMAFVLDRNKETNIGGKTRKSILLAVLLLLIAALRSPRTGVDTYGYYITFDKLLRNTRDWHFFFDEVIDAIKNHNFQDTIMWTFVSKLLTFVLPNAQVWLGVISAVFIVSAYSVIKRYSKDPIMSWVYLCIFIYSFILQGLRQSVAMAIVLLSFRFAYERKLGKFLFMIAFAYLFHQSSIAFIIAYPLYGLEIKRKHIVLLGVTFVLVIVAPKVITILLNFFARGTRFEGYMKRSGLYTASGAIVLSAVFLLCYEYKDKLIQADKVNKYIFVLSFVGILTQICAVLVAEMFRVSYYFSMFNMILVANTFEVMDNTSKAKNLLSRIILMYMFICYFYIGGGFMYKFYWQ